MFSKHTTLAERSFSWKLTLILSNRWHNTWSSVYYITQYQTSYEIHTNSLSSFMLHCGVTFHSYHSIHNKLWTFTSGCNWISKIFVTSILFLNPSANEYICCSRHRWVLCYVEYFYIIISGPNFLFAHYKMCNTSQKRYLSNKMWLQLCFTFSTPIGQKSLTFLLSFISSICCR